MDIAVITINYNSSDFTLQCVRSIIEKCKRPLNYKIVIVDNHSEEAEFRKLTVLEDNEHILLIRNNRNLGFSAANMQGVNAMTARYYYFLNNDTRLLNDVLGILFDFMEAYKDVGISSGQMYNPDGSLGINFNYFPDLKLKLFGSALLRIFFPGDFPEKKKKYDHPVMVPLLNGSSLFTRAEALERTGGFDTSFFLYCEEEDLALRMWQNGYRCYLVPDAEYIHYGGKSSKSDREINFLMLREFYLSQHYLYKKHYGMMASLTWRITQFFRSLRKFYIHKDYIKLAFFILKGPGFEKSIRHLQH